MSTQPASISPVESLLSSAEPFVDPDAAANYLQTTRRHVLEMVRDGLIPGHPLNPNAKKKDWRFLLSELHRYMLSCDQRPPGAHKPPRRV
jgi:Helix-turn-helix domain